MAELVIDLLPTSYLFRKGHSIRIALAGADRDHFVLPDGDPPTVHFYHGGDDPSRVELPVIEH